MENTGVSTRPAVVWKDVTPLTIRIVQRLPEWVAWALAFVAVLFVIAGLFPAWPLLAGSLSAIAATCGAFSSAVFTILPRPRVFEALAPDLCGDSTIPARRHRKVPAATDVTVSMREHADAAWEPVITGTTVDPETHDVTIEISGTVFPNAVFRLKIL